MERMIPLLSEQGIQIVSISDSPDNLPYLPKERDYAMETVDEGPKGTKHIYYMLNRAWDIPVVFVAGPKGSDGERLKLVYAYAYLPEEAGEAELMTHLKAAYRRFSEKRESSMETNLAPRRDWRIETVEYLRKLK